MVLAESVAPPRAESRTGASVSAESGTLVHLFLFRVREALATRVGYSERVRQGFGQPVGLLSCTVSMLSARVERKPRPSLLR